MLQLQYICSFTVFPYTITELAAHCVSSRLMVEPKRNNNE